LKRPTSIEDLGLSRIEDMRTVESHMIRYLYGPWDSLYYATLAYMIGKGLIEPPIGGKVDSFRLAGKGRDMLRLIEKDDAFDDLIRRAQTIHPLC
jgi:hypothetical protein